MADYAETLLPEDVVPTEEAPRYTRPTGALAAAAVDMAHHLGAAAIIASTIHGHTAALVSKNRPHQPILAVTSNPETCTQLPLLWGVTPMLVTNSGTPDEVLDRAVRQSCRAGLLHDGDLLIITAVNPHPVGVVTRASNVLRIATVQQKCLG
ncbi:MAG: Pyruvate kinase [bacterium ADurb.Bin429]|nr:MAG: Pyruvate kinase [bacterium ADurb.Bin429]